MKIRHSILLAALLSFMMATTGWAQNSSTQRDAQVLYNTLPIVLQNIQARSEMTSQFYAVAQQMGNYQELQLCQMEAQMHQAMYNGVLNLQQNSQQLMNPQVQKQLIDALSEYNYRSDMRDQRPYGQIQGQLAQYTAHAHWKSSTPEGRAAHQAGLNGIQATTRQNTANHNARMQAIDGQANAHNQAWRENQRIGDIRHGQNVHAVYNEYQYVDPNNNQGYWVPMETTNPTVIHGDGSYTELQPYQNY